MSSLDRTYQLKKLRRYTARLKANVIATCYNLKDTDCMQKSVKRKDKLFSNTTNRKDVNPVDYGPNTVR